MNGKTIDSRLLCEALRRNPAAARRRRRAAAGGTGLESVVDGWLERHPLAGGAQFFLFIAAALAGVSLLADLMEVP